jgi:hypothetical protein
VKELEIRVNRIALTMRVDRPPGLEREDYFAWLDHDSPRSIQLLGELFSDTRSGDSEESKQINAGESTTHIDIGLWNAFRKSEPSSVSLSQNVKLPREARSFSGEYPLIGLGDLERIAPIHATEWFRLSRILELSAAETNQAVI